MSNQPREFMQVGLELEAWSKDEELIKIVTEFDHQMYRAWLERKFKRKITWGKELLDVSMHKCRTAMSTVPTELRKASKAWLLENGWSSEDTDNL